MPLYPPRSPKPFACDIVAYNDEELDRYLEKVNRIFAVQDSENLPESFIERLRDRVRRENEIVQSRPVDLDQVAARLLEISPDNKELPPGSSLPTAQPNGDNKRDFDDCQLSDTSSTLTELLGEEESFRDALHYQRGHTMSLSLMAAVRLNR
ncbi:hypothetical protein AJ80_08864 [Polytolypa hystricis UAMH7299]|uniref:Uncharacterized protein n=1 Tax=Polytolypa hystricis (strain UAMH7299) TaxID=1447883 RepID=A0A2B7X0U6_POLH7|nr:hypothetical protein AJ80_08864 [Polytolypa hystricis UAMH7299]